MARAPCSSLQPRLLLVAGCFSWSPFAGGRLSRALHLQRRVRERQRGRLRLPSTHDEQRREGAHDEAHRCHSRSRRRDGSFCIGCCRIYGSGGRSAGSDREAWRRPAADSPHEDRRWSDVVPARQQGSVDGVGMSGSRISRTDERTIRRATADRGVRARGGRAELAPYDGLGRSRRGDGVSMSMQHLPRADFPAEHRGDPD